LPPAAFPGGFLVFPFDLWDIPMMKPSRAFVKPESALAKAGSALVKANSA
jgi:hypothetical protein